MRGTLRDRAGEWLISHGHERLADHFALVVMGPGARPAEAYLPLWRERWTRRDPAPIAGTPGDPPAGITADTGAMRLLEQLGRAAEGARPSHPA